MIKKCVVVLIITLMQFQSSYSNIKETLTIAILAKDKEHTLDQYLGCIEKQTWPKKQTYLYIRTNNNNDQTKKILENWVEKVKGLYLDIYFNGSDVEEPVQNYKQHEWNWIRFKVLGKIRQDSIHFARERKSHYFVADCDNFIKSNVIETLIKTNLPIVAPFLRTGYSDYSNYHAAIDSNGYFIGNAAYYMILKQEIRGLIEVPVVHCTYLIRSEVLKNICYDDESYRYEYVIFSDCARKCGIPQYIDNRDIYGRITMAETKEELLTEPWFKDILCY